MIIIKGLLTIIIFFKATCIKG
ncbi:hypothetical protein NITGR_430019 [Nitrospina gracilis 3/211]|uniref:Uncharacterized protein n=1 Tax=Nitrospina gracilis (strain 3/211) TaxID=1266370 RepID=M1YYQ9_NITG3|nr:hypothetical protein NITGR_430019 [Nitrospina gracilis 3/211]